MLELKHVVKRYGPVQALRGVDLDLPGAAVSGLVGPNGAGKTTLFSIIAGFVRPTSGSVYLNGEPQPGTGRPKGLIGILPQDARFQQQISILRQFVWYGRLMGLDASAAKAEARRVLEAVDLVEAAGSHGDRLSHGMHKRMAIAQALIGDPSILLLDEPTAGLDPNSARRVRDLIREQRGRRLVLVSSHNLEEIGDICDHVTVIDRGRIVDAKSMADFTGRQARISVRLTEAADPSVADRVKELDGIASTELSADRLRLFCTLEPDAGDDPKIASSIIGVLAEMGVGFEDVSRGSTVEQRFLEMTGKPSR
jgi:ABC-type multidrug transport system ATPase subunit